ncbi:MAG: aminotransferase class I/II-fold pyridoxal phosphate-dependent enzyme [Burkholderiaceae bacterium]|nr:aminotransferase class I/II-fold pyridoxal phosphate-dependent enzyme [Burkholderiaceae bacterium]
MIYFQCDYAEGAHPRILDALVKTNFEQTPGYGVDVHCQNACKLIQEKIGKSDARVHFLVGGTQTNLTVIASLLKPHQGVIGVDTGHISCHETGAIEATGHKVLQIPAEDGKLSSDKLQAFLKNYWADDTHEHIVEPGMVYISSPTEVGTVYTKKELESLKQICRKYQIPLFLDGARLGYGLASEENDVFWKDLPNLVDVFYIGGTKCGALFGEAVVFCDDQNLDRHFRPIMKQKGGMLAKGRLLGIQFETLFTEDLYEKITTQAVQEALRLRDAFKAKGFEFLVDSPTNQQFPILDRKSIETLSQKFAFMIWPDNGEEKLATRFCTSWATKSEQVDELIAEIQQL